VVDVLMVRAHVIGRYSGFDGPTRARLLAGPFLEDLAAEAPPEYAAALDEAVAVLHAATGRHLATCRRILLGTSPPHADDAIAMAVVLAADPRTLFQYDAVVARVIDRLAPGVEVTPDGHRNPAIGLPNWPPNRRATDPGRDWPTLPDESARRPLAPEDPAGECAGVDCNPAGEDAGAE